MATTDQQEQQLIIRKVGDVNPETGDPTLLNDGVIATNIALLWSSYDDKPTRRIQAMFVQRDAIEMVISCLTQLVDFSQDNQSVKLSQRVKTYRDKYDACTQELNRAVSISARGAPAYGSITRAAPPDPRTYPPGPGVTEYEASLVPVE